MVRRFDRDAFLNYLVQYWLIARASQVRESKSSTRAVDADRTLRLLLALRDRLHRGMPDVRFHRERQALSFLSKNAGNLVAKYSQQALDGSRDLKKVVDSDATDAHKQLIHRGQPFFDRASEFPGEGLFEEWQQEPLNIELLLDGTLRREIDALGVPLTDVVFSGVVLGGTIDRDSWIGIRDTDLAQLPTVRARGELLNCRLTVPTVPTPARAAWLEGSALQALSCTETLTREAVRDLLEASAEMGIDAGGVTFLGDGAPLGLADATIVAYSTDLSVAARTVTAAGFAAQHLVVAAGDATADAVLARDELYAEFRNTTVHLLDEKGILDIVSHQPWNWSAHSSVAGFSFVRAADTPAFHTLFRRHEQSVDLPYLLPTHPAIPATLENWRFVGLPGSGKSITLSQAILAHLESGLVLFIETDAAAADLVIARRIVGELHPPRLVIVLDDLHQLLASERTYVLDEVVQFLGSSNVHIVAAYAPLRRDQLRDEHHAFFARAPFAPETSLVATEEFFRQVAWHAGAALRLDESEPRIFAVADAAFLHDARPASLVRELRQFQESKFDPLVIQRLQRSTYERWTDEFNTLCQRNSRVADVLEIIGFYRFIGLRYSLMSSIARLFTEFLHQPAGEFRAAVAVLQRAHILDVQVREKDGVPVEVLDGASTMVRPELNTYLDGRARPARYMEYMEWVVAHRTEDVREHQIDLEYIATKYSKLGRPSDALRIIEVMAREVPPSNIHAALAMVCADAGQHDRAIAEIRAHVTAHPQQFGNWLSLARALLSGGAHEHVRTCMREYLLCALRASSSEEELFRHALNMVGHRDDVIGSCGFLLEQAPGSEGALEAVLRILIGLGCFEEALGTARLLARHPAGVEHVVPLFAPLLSIDAAPLENLIFATAALHIEGGESRGAAALLSEFPIVQACLEGEAAYQRGEWQDAARHLRIVVDGCPDLIRGYLSLFSHYVASVFFSNDIDGAINLIAASNVSREHLRPFDAFVYGAALYYRGRYEEALALLQRVDPRTIGDIQLAPWQRLSAIARAHLARGENEQAADAAQEILRTINEFDPGAHVVRAAAFSRIGKDPLPGFVRMDFARLGAEDRLLLAEAFLRSGHSIRAIEILSAASIRGAKRESLEALESVLAAKPEAVRAACRFAMA
jgi:tetratricopeptide (TPR) repeat protein